MRQPTIEWQVLGSCNYNCSYCIQSPKHRVGVPDENAIDAILRFFAKLPIRYEIKMSGGEPFTHPLFLDRIIPRLVSETPHLLSVLTNLSAEKADLERFSRRASGRLGIVSTSMHLERVTPEAFIDRALHLRGFLAADSRLVVIRLASAPIRMHEKLICLRERKDSKAINPANQVRVRARDRLEVVKVAATQKPSEPLPEAAPVEEKKA